MNTIIKRKIQYAFYSPIVWFYLLFRGVKKRGKSWYNGVPFIKGEKGVLIIIGSNCRFCSRTTANPLGNKHRCMITALSDGAVVEIGDDCGLSGTTICCSHKVTIDNNVRCGANTAIIDTDGHEEDFRSGDPHMIHIENHVWLGNDSIVLKGVTIGRYAMIGAGSVVRTSVPPYAVTIGNPAKIIGFSKTPEEILEFEKTHFDEKDRLPFDLLMKNYQKYFLNNIKKIKDYSRISL